MSKEKKRELNWYQANDSEAMARRLERQAADYRNFGEEGAL